MSIKKIKFSPDFSALSAWGHNKTPFFALVDFDGNLLAEPLKTSDFTRNSGVLQGRITLGAHALHFKFNCAPQYIRAMQHRNAAKPPMVIEREPKRPVILQSIQALQHELGDGFSYLVNYCSQTEIRLVEPLISSFAASVAPFTVFFENQFISFSPEAFVSIVNNEIITTPMKGTGYDDAALLADAKEQAEHATIVDLLRNDIGRVATGIQLGRYRYLTGIPQSDGRTLYQTSTEIRGKMPADWRSRIGEWLPLLLPAGSVTGAPKKKTVELIRKYENEPRGFFTGIAAAFDGEHFYSCVLIRYIDLVSTPYKFRSGAGITIYSDPEAEYREILSKVYLPV